MLSGEGIVYVLLLLMWGSAISATQIIVFREYICASGGNELSLGISLSIWLLFNAAGALIWMGINREIKGRLWLVVLSGLILSLISILSLRFMRLIFGLPLGTPPGFTILLLSSFLSVMPPAFISGFSFPYFCKLVRGVNYGVRVGFIYAIESFGLVIGYLLTALFIYAGMNHMSILLSLYLASLIAALFIRFRLNLVKVTLLFIPALFFVYGFGYLDNLVFSASFEASFRGFSYIAHKDTNYNRYVIARRGEEYSLFVNNQFSKTIADEYNSKVFSHLAMTISDRKGRVLLAGEASYDILRHIIEHKPLEVDYIEYDRGLSDFTRKYITNLQIDSSSVRLINDDARRFIQSVSNRYDLIILDIPEPENLQLNRYFTVEFFDASKRSLKEGGILIFSLPSIASQASFSKTEFLISVYSAVKEVFSNVIPLSFEKIYVFASDAPISIDLETLIERFRGYNLNCDFEPELMSLALDDYNNQRVLKILTSKVLNPNRDKNPYALFASLMLYEMSSNNKGESVLFYIRWIKLYHICIFFFLIFIVVTISRKKSVVTGTLMASQGFVSMSLEIMVIYLFQIRYGVLYQYMAMLFAIFMLGLGAGSLFFKKYKFSCALLPSINILVSLFLLFFNPEMPSFFALLLIDGLVTGVYFGHLSASLVDAEDRSVVRSASVMDFADSFGAMLAGFFLPIVFLPLYNFSNTLIVLIILSALSIVLHTMAKLSGTER